MVKTSSSSSSMGIADKSDVAFESRETGLPAENNGCGGSGRIGLPGRPPPYREEGVPGRGLPLMSEGSYEAVVAGGRV